MAISIFYPHRKFWRSLHGTNFPWNFKRPKNSEDGSDFDDFWTKRIAALSAKFCKIFALSKKFSWGQKLQKTFAKSSKKFVPRAISDDKQNRNGQMFVTSTDAVRRTIQSTMEITIAKIRNIETLAVSALLRLQRCAESYANVSFIFLCFWLHICACAIPSCSSLSPATRKKNETLIFENLDFKKFWYFGFCIVHWFLPVNLAIWLQK